MLSTFSAYVVSCQIFTALIPPVTLWVSVIPGQRKCPRKTKYVYFISPFVPQFHLPLISFFFLFALTFPSHFYINRFSSLQINILRTLFLCRSLFCRPHFIAISFWLKFCFYLILKSKYILYLFFNMLRCFVLFSFDN